MYFARDPGLFSTICVLLYLLLTSACDARIGDHWAALAENTPVYEGPDRSFRIRTYIGPDDVVRQQSNRKIRGFIKVVVPLENYATGYVREEQLEFLGGMESEQRPGTDRNNTTDRPAGSVREPGPQDKHRWIMIITMLLIVLALLTVAWMIFRRRSWAAGFAQRVDGFSESLNHWFSGFNTFLERKFRRGRFSSANTKPDSGLDRSFIDDLLPADLDSADPSADRPTRSSEVSHVEQFERLYDLLLRELEIGPRLPDLWRKALLKAEGEEEAAKHQYVQLLIHRISRRRRLEKDPSSS